MDTNAENVKEAASTHLSDEEAEQRLGEMFREVKSALRAKSKNELVRVAASLALELFKQRTINEAMQKIMENRNHESSNASADGASNSHSTEGSAADATSAVIDSQAKVD